MNLSKYKNNNFVGIDQSLEISFYEYGLIWKEYKRSTKNKGKKGEFLFVYPIKNMEGEIIDHDYGYIMPKDLRIEFDWIEWNSIYSYTGLSENEFHSMEFGQQIFDLVNYYGTLEIFES